MNIATYFIELILKRTLQNPILDVLKYFPDKEITKRRTEDNNTINLPLSLYVSQRREDVFIRNETCNYCICDFNLYSDHESIFLPVKIKENNN